MKIAIFDYLIVKGNPAGSCHLKLLDGLSSQHEFTVFSVEFENPHPDRIRWVRVPATRRPLVLLFLTFHLVAPILYLLHRFRYQIRFDIVQYVEVNYAIGNVAYVHFCHRAYLKKAFWRSRPPGIRGLIRWMDHFAHAAAEPRILRYVDHIIVPSKGLERELVQEYPFVTEKVQVIPNPIELEAFARPDAFDRERFRQDWNLKADDMVLIFVALGQFERKGLPLLLKAIMMMNDPKIKLLIVGGKLDLIASYQKFVVRNGLDDAVVFAGMQENVEKFFWSADIFVLPSHYEVFPLVALEAAGAGLPLLVTPLHGVEEILCDGENGILIDHTPESISRGIRRFKNLSSEERISMGGRAQHSVKQFKVEKFIESWQVFYEKIDVV